MIRKDGFGNDISPSTYAVMEKYGVLLLSKSFTESWEKQNLFHKNTPEANFYADMRGTPEIPIVEDTRPVFYCLPEKNVPLWKVRRHMKIELEELNRSGCFCRLPYNMRAGEGVFAGTHVVIYQEICYYGWNDGYCGYCGKDFQDEGSFCSDECKQKYHDATLENCKVCNESLEGREHVKHHVSYFPEEIIFVHRKCHDCKPL